MKRIILLSALFLSFTNIYSQEIEELKIDSDVSVISTDSSKVKQYKLSDCDSIIQAHFSNYEFIYSKGLVGIYDIKNKRCVTDIEYSTIECSCHVQDGSNQMYVFNCTKRNGGSGILFVKDDDDTTMFMGAKDN
jgi:hypothetical protein